MTILAQLQRLILPNAQQSDALLRYITITEQARQPFFYSELGVPDTLDGRFEMIALHLALVMETLGPQEKRAIMECFLADMDRNLREMGVGDMGVGRRVQTMASAFYGRQEAFAKAGSNKDALKSALRRNVYGTVMDVKEEWLEKLADYMLQTVRAWQSDPQNCLKFPDIA